MKDTLRVLVGWDCNLACSYCCNKLPEVRAGITPAKLEDLDFGKYKVVCISGGEPLLDIEAVQRVCEHSRQCLVVLYTNGLLLDRATAHRISADGVDAVNVGLHNPHTLVEDVKRILRATENTNLEVRFHVQECYARLAAYFDFSPRVDFKFWKMNDCARDNEDRVILEPAQ